jgi:hypothetical protein
LLGRRHAEQGREFVDTVQSDEPVDFGIDPSVEALGSELGLGGGRGGRSGYEDSLLHAQRKSLGCLGGPLELFSAGIFRGGIVRVDIVRVGYLSLRNTK